MEIPASFSSFLPTCQVRVSRFSVSTSSSSCSALPPLRARAQNCVPDRISTGSHYMYTGPDHRTSIYAKLLDTLFPDAMWLTDPLPYTKLPRSVYHESAGLV